MYNLLKNNALRGVHDKIYLILLFIFNFFSRVNKSNYLWTNCGQSNAIEFYKNSLFGMQFHRSSLKIVFIYTVTT